MHVHATNEHFAMHNMTSSTSHRLKNPALPKRYPLSLCCVRDSRADGGQAHVCATHLRRQWHGHSSGGAWPKAHHGNSKPAAGAASSRPVENERRIIIHGSDSCFMAGFFLVQHARTSTHIRGQCTSVARSWRVQMCQPGLLFTRAAGMYGTAPTQGVPKHSPCTATATVCSLHAC